MLKYVKNAINIIDELKRYNAIIDEEKCINCRAYHRVYSQNKQVVKKYQYACIKVGLMMKKYTKSSRQEGLL